MPTVIVFWHWWALAAVLLVVELLAPGVFFIWLSESALIVGGILWLFPGMGEGYQLLLFSVLAVLNIGVLRRLMIRHPIQTDHPLLNRRTAQYTGRIFVLQEPITNGRGRIRVDDSIWRVEGADCAAGSRVRVKDADGVILKVERVE